MGVTNPQVDFKPSLAANQELNHLSFAILVRSPMQPLVRLCYFSYRAGIFSVDFTTLSVLKISIFVFRCKCAKNIPTQ